MSVSLLNSKNLYAFGSLTSKDLKKIEPKKIILGQDRALLAIDRLIQQSLNYHLFCIGAKGLGRTSITERVIREYAIDQTETSDWVYLADFNDKKNAIPLPFLAGQAPMFAHVMNSQMSGLRRALKEAFSEENYQVKLKKIDQKYHQLYHSYIAMIHSKLDGKDVRVNETDIGLGLVPVFRKKALSSEKFNELPKVTRKRLLSSLETARQNLAILLKQMPDFQGEKKQEIDSLNQETAEKLIDLYLSPVVNRYSQVSGITSYLGDLKNFLLRHLSCLYDQTDSIRYWRRVRVNSFVSRPKNSGLPVIHLNTCSLSNLFGRIGCVDEKGLLLSDHLLIQPGALHKANGGFLIIDAQDLIENPSVWKSLKRALFEHKVKILDPQENLPSQNMNALVPQEIPLNVKVILVGDVNSYYKLAQDEEFSELFKLQACFSDSMARTKEIEKEYVSSLLYFIKRASLLPFDVDALNRIIEYASRLSKSQLLLTEHFSKIFDLMREANLEANLRKAKKVSALDIELALQNRQYLLNKVQLDWLDSLKRGVFQMKFSGEKVGEVNALVVHEVGAFVFGRPAKVSCRIQKGTGKIIDVEKEVELGGHLHTKGVLILSSFLKSTYGAKEIFGLDASLVWEQSYSEVEGDSASAAELCALMSSIGNIPIKQSFAVTGSVNQLGEIQTVGSINEKIEGYFDACFQAGLTGKQGVIIPSVSISNLMISERVRKAVEDKKFFVYSADTIFDVMEILTGKTKQALDKIISKAWHENNKK